MKVAAEVTYPFDLPPKLHASLDIDTSKKHPFNNLLLGLNCSWPEGQYGMEGYNHPDAQKLIRTFKPTSLRFPHGVWANFYDWESDGRRITDQYKTSYDDAVRKHPDLKYGFAGFDTLHKELAFDVLFTWNVNYDSPEKGARRLVDLRDKGFKPKWIELGNEIFWKTQRSEAVSDLEKYITVSKAHTAALKAVDPTVKVSVPVHWRDALKNEWNLPLMKQDYFDAISVHKYIIKQDSAQELGATLDARREMVEMGRTLSQAFGNRPLWVSEWSVNCADPAISVLGMTDTYLGFFAHPELFEVTSYFQMNAEHPLIEYDKKTGTHTRTILAAAYDVIRGVFEGSEQYESHIESTKIGPDLDAVSAEVVVKDGKVTVFAINKTNRPVPLSLSFNGKPDARAITHRALLLEKPRPFTLSEDVLTDVPSNADGILLPPLSLSRMDVCSQPANKDK